MGSRQQTHFLYFGRLDDEKGFGTIVQAVNYFLQHAKKLPFVLTVFGAGKYTSTIKKFAHKDKNIHYFGFQSLDIIKQHAKQSDYILMPSLFLETFGLSALNALSRGIPVIGYKKGGLEPFILADYDLTQYTDTPVMQLVQMLKKLMGEDAHYIHNKQTLTHIAKQYDFDQRFTHFQSLCGGPKKILLVSDFTQKLGGIETYIYAIAQELRLYGYTVRIIGNSGGQTRWSRLGSMLLSLCNIPFALRLRSCVYHFQPDVIRYHSVLRCIGRLPLALAPHKKSYIMLHDLGYIHPYPHRVYQEADVPSSSSLLSFVRSAKSNNPLIWIAVAGKWVLLRLLWLQFVRMQAIVLPSSYMQGLLTPWTNNRIHILPHFIQK